MSELEIIPVTTPEQLAQLRALFVEYAESLSYHICFESFQQELNQLPGIYGPPAGRLILALADGQPAGCAALKQVEAAVGELKRLYVRLPFRGCGLGRRLTEKVLSEARALGYRAVRLDTLPSMKEARALYHSLGFRPVAASQSAGCGDKPIDMELQLT
jgi:putative acetyltransferase